MSLPVFLSYPKPFNEQQQAFMAALLTALEFRGLTARTLGVNEYDNELPLVIVRRMLLESNGIIAIALRRHWVLTGATKPGSTAEAQLEKKWFTSPWPHMETAMAYQIGLPILVLREKGVHEDGVFERGTMDRFLFEVDTSNSAAFFNSPQWTHLFASWERDVRTVSKNRGVPPKLY